MDLFNPESGLVIWMLVVFLLLLFILGKYAYPYITKSIAEREENINNAVKVADEAHAKLQKIEEERRAILAKATEEQNEAIKAVKEMQARLEAEAEGKARNKAEKIIAEARASIEAERQQALKDVRNEVARLSVNIAGKVLQKELAHDDAQMELVNRLIEEEQLLNN